MKRLFLATASIALATGLAWSTAAEACSSNPYNLVNGTTADASQVMADINNALGCIGALQPNATGSTTLATGLTIPAPIISGNTTAAVRVASNAAMAAIATATYPNGVIRDDYAGGIGAPPQYYRPETGSCGANSRVNDGGSCTDTTAGDGNSWYAVWPGGGMDIREWGVKADGASSDDVAFAAAAKACTAKTGKILVPQNTTLTGAATVYLNDCLLAGEGPAFVVANGSPVRPPSIKLLSTTTAPFIVGGPGATSGGNLHFQDLLFYWPNQTTGSVVYPPLLQNDGTHGFGLVNFHNVGVANAYDFIAISGNNSGNVNISDSQIYAVHDLIKASGSGDFWNWSNNILNPGLWYNYTNFALTAAYQTAAKNNTVLHLTAVGVGPDMNIEAVNQSLFAWHWLVKQDDGSSINLSRFDINADNVSVYWDASALTSGNTPHGSTLNISCPYSCNAGDGAQGITYTTPVFDMGSQLSNTLNLTDFKFSSGRPGDIIDSGKSDVTVRASNLQVKSDGVGDYYIMNNNNTAGGHIIFLNNTLGGDNTIKTHGIFKGSGAAVELQVVGNSFGTLNDHLNVTLDDGVDMFESNVIGSTVGTTPIIASGTGPFYFGGNFFDKRLGVVPVLSTCGTNPTLQGGSGMLAGVIFPGTGSPTACTMTQPFNLGGGACVFAPNGGTKALTAAVGGSPSVWTIQATDGSALPAIFYNCAGSGN